MYVRIDLQTLELIIVDKYTGECAECVLSVCVRWHNPHKCFFFLLLGNAYNVFYIISHYWICLLYNYSQCEIKTRWKKKTKFEVASHWIFCVHFRFEIIKYLIIKWVQFLWGYFIWTDFKYVFHIVASIVE